MSKAYDLIDEEYDLCLRIATKAHEGEFRRGSGEPYIQHPIRVADTMKGMPSKCIALLHDVIENSDETVETLKAQGVSDFVAKGVDILTMKNGQRYIDYIKQIVEYPYLARIKMSDMDDNLAGEPSDRQREKYHKAHGILSDCVGDSWKHF